jgi:hypothetical protein
MGDLLQKYRTWVRSDPESARRAEDLLRVVAFMVPRQVASAGATEITSEIAYSAANLVSVVNDAIISASDVTATVAEGTRWLLAGLGCADIVAEVVATRLGGDRVRWRVISLVEALRALAKLYLLVSDGQRMQCRGGHPASRNGSSAEPVATADGGSGGTAANGAAAGASGGGAGDGGTWWRGGLSGLTVPMAAAGAAPSSAAAPAQDASAQQVSLLLGQLLHAVEVLRGSIVAERDYSLACDGYPTSANGEFTTLQGTNVETDAAAIRALGEVLYILRPLM